MRSLDEWDLIVNGLTLTVAAIQVESAQAASDYMATLIGSPVSPVNPRAFAGSAVTADPEGLASSPLSSYLYGAVVHARGLYGSGADDAQIAEAGEAWLSMLVRTQVADAARMATATAVVATPKAHWYRVIQPPCCQRCAVLRDRTFAWNSTFQRHPRCDCMVGGLVTDSDPPPSGIELDDIRDLTKAQREAVSMGADLNQVINARRGTYTRTINGKSVQFTTEGTTKRGFYARVRSEIDRQRGEVAAWIESNAGRRGAVANYTVRRTSKSRLTPEAIRKYATSREEAVRLLAANGYILGDPTAIAQMAL